MSKPKKKAKPEKSLLNTDVSLLASKAGEAFRELETEDRDLSLDLMESEEIEAEAVESSDDLSDEQLEEQNENPVEYESRGIDFDENEDLRMIEDAEADAVAVENVLQGTELEAFESVEIEDLEVLTQEQIRSIVESILFTTDKPLSIAVIKQCFKGTQVKSKDIREVLHTLVQDYEEPTRGFTLEEISGGFQLRTKAHNARYLRQTVKARPFRLSGPALEVLSICAYKQPVTKAQIDEIRGVESGHLLRALMEKSLINFGERSDLPGKPMFYETTKKFLEIFGLRNVQELPNLHEIDQLIPEGIGPEEEKETLGDLTLQLSQEVASTYSVGEEELLNITDELMQISTSSDFFEQEKRRMKEKRDQERAQNIREAMAIGEMVEDKDLKWLERYDLAIREQVSSESDVAFVTGMAEEAIAAFEGDEGIPVDLEAKKTEDSEVLMPLEPTDDQDPENPTEH